MQRSNPLDVVVLTHHPITTAAPARPFTPCAGRYRNRVAPLVLACLSLTSASAAVAGGYVDGIAVLNPARAINTGAVSVTPTFNNDQFNDRVLVGTVNNDPVRTPSTADPVSTVTGNNYHDETDFVIRGRNGLNIVFTRTFNSAPTATQLDRGLGYGWSHSYLMRLKSNDFGVCPNCTSAQKPENANAKTSSITYTDERGGEQNYLVNETSFAVTAPKGVYDTLALDTPTLGQHTLSFRNGVKYLFETPTGNLKTTPNVVARLKTIDNAWGDRLTLGYDASGRLTTLTDNLGISGRSGIGFTYHADGRLKDVTDWSTRKWSFTYDSAGNLQTMTNPLAQVLSYGYDAPEHLLTSIAKPLQRDGSTVQTQFKYYENARTFQQTNSLGQGDTLDYDLYRKSTRVTDARGFVREYFYDDNGRMVKLVEPDGGVLLFENQGDAIRSKKYDALGYATTYSYRTDKAFTGSADQFGNVTREQDALNQTVDMSYGPLDQVASSKDKRGTVFTTTFAATSGGCDYASRPKETRVSSLSGSTNVLVGSLCWNSNATLNYSRSYLDATRYRETRLAYEAGSNGLNVSQEQVVGMPTGITVTKTTTYDNLGRKKTETLKRRTSPTNAALLDLTTTYDYDALDRLIKLTDSLGNEAINSIDANGQLWKVTHRYKLPDGSFEVRDVITRTFDAADRVKTETDAEGNVATFSYDEAGNVIALLDAEGHTTRFEYDAMNRRTAVIDATGYRTETTYTLRGDVVGIQNANDEAVKFDVDALGRKTAVVDAKGNRSTFQYDANGNLTCTIDANAHFGSQPKNNFNCSESRSYDELNRVTKIVDALNGETTFTYDLAGNRLTVKDAENKTWSFAYDDLGRLAGETDHSAMTLSYKLDEAGNLYEKTNRLNELTRYSLDAANRLTRVDYLKDGTTETYGFDAAGNRNAAANNTVGYSFTWDRLNRLTSKTDSRGRALGFTFDKVGNILTKTTFQGSTTSYIYNAANRLVMLRNPDYTQVDYQYDPAGRLLSRVTASGAHASYQYDANGWLTRLAQFDAANAPVSDTSYTRDHVGNILTQVGANGTTTYTQDALYRLKTADYPGTTNDEAFEYDKVGNRKQYTKGSLTANANTRYYNYTTGSNRLAEIRIGSASGALELSFTHDFEGRLISQSGTEAKMLTWDAKGRVKTVGGESYQYDPMDYRIGRTGGALGNRSYFLEGEHLESEYSGANLQAKYFRGRSVDELVAGYLYDTDGKLKPYHFHHDQVTSTTAVSGHNGGAIQSIQYAAFGATQSNAGSSSNRLKYTGREDDGTGLYYYRARYYDPAIGRFISEDPLGFGAGDVNFHQYTSNNPLNGNDPNGLDTIVSYGYKSIGLFDTNHLVVILTDTVTGQRFATRAGPESQGFFGFASNSALSISGGSSLATSGNGGSGGFGFGQVVAQAGSYTERFIDEPSEIHIIQQVGTIKRDFSDSVANAIEFSIVTNNSSIPYLLLGPNSNSYASTFVEKLTGVRSTPIASAPGWNEQLGTSAVSFAPSTFVLGGANGGYLLYPNKFNTNLTQSVYTK